MMKNTFFTMLIVLSCSMSAQSGDYRSYYHYMMGEKYFMEDDLESAIMEYVKASVYDPASPEIRTRIASCYLRSGDVESAVVNIKRALELDPANLEAMSLYSDVMIVERDFEKALELCSRILEAEPEDTKAMHCKATMLIGLQRNQEALQVLKQHLSRNLDDERAYYGVGLIYDSMSNFKEAEKYYLKALELDPGYHPAAVDLMGIYEEMYSGERFITKLEELAQLTNLKIINDKIVRTHMEMASRKKDRSTALVHYKKAIARLELMENEYPELSNIKMQKAMIQDEMGDPSAAINTLEEALRLSPDNERLMFYLATLYERNNKKEQALGLMERIIEINPDNADALNYVGYVYADNKRDLKKAKDLVSRALKLMPDDPYITDSLGWVYYNSGDYKNARIQLEKALDLAKGKKSFEPEIIEHLMSVYRDMGMNDKIKQTYSDLLNSGIYKENSKELKTLFEKFNDLQPERMPASIGPENKK